MDPRRVNIYSGGAGIIHTDVGAAIYQLFMAHSSPSLRWPPVTADARLRTTYRCRCGRLFDTRLGRKECPDVYFAGNQPAFATSLLEGSGGQKVGAGKQKKCELLLLLLLFSILTFTSSSSPERFCA